MSHGKSNNKRGEYILIDLKDYVMQIINGRSQVFACDLNKIEAEKHRRLIDIVDKAWDDKGLNGRNSKHIQ